MPVRAELMILHLPVIPYISHCYSINCLEIFSLRVIKLSGLNGFFNQLWATLITALITSVQVCYQ